MSLRLSRRCQRFMRRPSRYERPVPNNAFTGLMLFRHFFNESVNMSKVNNLTLMYDQNGPPRTTLQATTSNVLVFSLADDQVHVRMLAAPIHPSDINLIEGSYGIKATFPAVGGNEGVGRIERVGAGVRHMAVGDWVIPARTGLGTWRRHIICSANELLSVPNTLPLARAAALFVNPVTAYKLIHDNFNNNAPSAATDDSSRWLWQNAATSAVGRNVIQIAKHMGISTVNLIRARPTPEQTQETIAQLKALGATHVVVEDTMNESTTKQWLKSLPKPRVAFNSVGGMSSASLAAYLADGGTLITFGGMSKRPVTIPTGKFIFNQIIAKGFWLNQWAETLSSAQRADWIKRIVDLIQRGALSDDNVKWIEFADIPAAFDAIEQPYRMSTVMFRME